MLRSFTKFGFPVSSIATIATIALLSGCAAKQTVTLHVVDHETQRPIAEVEVVRELLAGDALSFFMEPETRTLARTDASGVAVINLADADERHRIRIEDLRHVSYVLTVKGNELVLLESQPHPPTSDVVEMIADRPLDPQLEEIDRIPISNLNTHVSISMRTSSVLEEFFLAGILQAVAPEKLARLSDAEFEAALVNIVNSLAPKYAGVPPERIATIVRDARRRAQSAMSPSTRSSE